LLYWLWLLPVLPALLRIICSCDERIGCCGGGRPNPIWL
jgi:hypothetical protein